jgi:hypothetical protein
MIIEQPFAYRVLVFHVEYTDTVMDIFISASEVSWRGVVLWILQIVYIALQSK